MPKRRQKKISAGSKKSKASQPAEKIIETVEPSDERVERDKKMFMWVGISCLMVIFFVVWIIGLKYEFRINLHKGASSGFDWQQTRIELDRAMTQVKQGVAEIKKIKDNVTAPAPAEQNVSEPKISAEQLDFLKSKLLDEIATSTASSTKQ